MTFAIVFVGWIFSLCLHEFSHALVAYLGGDHTVKDKGYLTFNPLRYTDPFLSLILPLIFLVMGGIGLPGGAVYIERWRLRGRGWQSAVSLAGPMANVVMLAVLGISLHFAPFETAYAQNSPWPGLAFLAFIQVSAIVLNLLPLPPFDGYGVVEPFLPIETREQIDRMRGFLPLIVFAALFFVPPVYNAFWQVVGTISQFAGIPDILIGLGYTRFQFWSLH